MSVGADVRAWTGDMLQRAGVQVLPWGRFGRQMMRARLPEPADDPPRPGRFRVPLSHMRSIYGWSYAREGWHPWVAGLEQLLESPSLATEDSVFYRYRTTFEPASAQDWQVFAGMPPIEPLASWPPVRPFRKHFWGLGPRAAEVALARRSAQPRPERSLDEAVRSHARGRLESLRATFESIRRHGYHPERHDEHPISGFFMVRGARWRFIVIHGFHRCAALRVAQVDEAVVALQPQHPAVVDAEELERWTEACGGVYTPDAAARLFEATFSATGVAKARSLDLL